MNAEINVDQSSGRGCLFYGCLSAVLLAALLFVAVFLGGYFALNYLSNNFLSDEPRPVPTISISQSEQKQVVERFDTFLTQVKSGTAENPLRLKGEDLTALVRNHPDLDSIGDGIYLTIERDKIRAKLSIPLDAFELNIWPFQGQFLNGEGILRIGMENKVIYGYLDSIEVGGIALGDAILSEVRGENLFEDLNTDKEAMDYIRKIERIEITGGELVIYPDRVKR